MLMMQANAADKPPTVNTSTYKQKPTWQNSY